MKNRRKTQTECIDVRKPPNRKHGNDKFKVASLNPDNALDLNKLNEITRTLEKHKIDVAGIQETHDTRNIRKRIGNYIYITSKAAENKNKNGIGTYAIAGVAFLVHIKWKPYYII